MLSALAKAGSEGLTKYAVEMDSGVSHYDVLKALKALAEIGWVEQLPTEPVRYRLNLDDEAMIGLIEFFRKAGYIQVVFAPYGYKYSGAQARTLPALRIPREQYLSPRKRAPRNQGDRSHKSLMAPGR